MSPEQELKLDNLITELALEIAEIKKDREQRELISVRLERIERALAIPLTYSLAQACKRLGYSVRWGYDHLSKLPAPVSTDPLRYRIEEVDTLALGRDTAPRNAPRRRRQAARKGDAA